jgi:hypothetical protein
MWNSNGDVNWVNRTRERLMLCKHANSLINPDINIRTRIQINDTRKKILSLLTHYILFLSFLQLLSFFLFLFFCFFKQGELKGYLIYNAISVFPLFVSTKFKDKYIIRYVISYFNIFFILIFDRA